MKTKPKSAGRRGVSPYHGGGFTCYRRVAGIHGAFFYVEEHRSPKSDDSYVPEVSS